MLIVQATGDNLISFLAVNFETIFDSLIYLEQRGKKCTKTGLAYSKSECMYSNKIMRFILETYHIFLYP